MLGKKALYGLGDFQKLKMTKTEKLSICKGCGHTKKDHYIYELNGNKHSGCEGMVETGTGRQFCYCKEFKK